MDTAPHLARLTKIWGLTWIYVRDERVGLFPLRVRACADPDFSFSCTIPGPRNQKSSEFKITCREILNGPSLTWTPEGGIMLWGMTAQKWADSCPFGKEVGTIRNLFLRGCFLSGCPVPIETLSAHELAAWFDYGRERGLDRAYLKRVCK